MALSARTNGPVTDWPQAPHGVPPVTAPEAVEWLWAELAGPDCDVCDSAEDESSAGPPLCGYGDE